MKRQRPSTAKSGSKRPRLASALNSEFQTLPVQTLDDVAVPAPKSARQLEVSNTEGDYLQIRHPGNLDSTSDSQIEIVGDFNDLTTCVLGDSQRNPSRNRSKKPVNNTEPNYSSASSFDDIPETLEPFVTIVDSDSDDDSECEEIQVTTHEEKDSLCKRSSKSIREFECPICFDIPDKTIGLACGHVYCFGCLFEAFSHSSERKTNEATCALCRKKFTLLKAIPLVFKTRQKEVSN